MRPEGEEADRSGILRWLILGERTFAAGGRTGEEEEEAMIGFCSSRIEVLEALDPVLANGAFLLNIVDDRRLVFSSLSAILGFL